MRRFSIRHLWFPCAALAFLVACQQPDSRALEERNAALEKRVQELEAQVAELGGGPQNADVSAPPRGKPSTEVDDLVGPLPRNVRPTVGCTYGDVLAVETIAEVENRAWIVLDNELRALQWHSRADVDNWASKDYYTGPGNIWARVDAAYFNDCDEGEMCVSKVGATATINVIKGDRHQTIADVSGGCGRSAG